MATNLPQHLVEGAILKGKYRVERTLGEGGMGVVARARHLALDRPVALKFLHAEMREHPEIVERFTREARAASKIQSDYVARVIDVDALDDGTPFIVMEYLEGSDLSSARRSGQAMPVADAVRCVLEACDAIGEAHQQGIVHRDIKPANLFLARRPDGSTRVKVLDFGISKLNGPGDASTTQTTAIMGSAEYMAPEQMLASKNADAQSDVWALGVTLYELLTARAPFEGESLAAVCALVMSAEPAPPSRLRAGVPPELDALVLACLQKDRALRVRSVPELAARLRAFVEPAVDARASRASFVHVEPGPAPSIGNTAAVLSRDAPSPSPSTASSRAWLAVPGVLAIALVIGAIAVLRARSSPSVAVVSAQSDTTTRPTIAATSAPASEPTLEVAPAPSAPSLAVEASATARASSPIARTPLHATAAPTSRPVASQGAAPAPAAQPRSCNPPFTIDANGVKHAKPECL